MRISCKENVQYVKKKSLLKSFQKAVKGNLGLMLNARNANMQKLAEIIISKIKRSVMQMPQSGIKEIARRLILEHEKIMQKIQKKFSIGYGFIEKLIRIQQKDIVNGTKKKLMRNLNLEITLDVGTLSNPKIVVFVNQMNGLKDIIQIMPSLLKSFGYARNVIMPFTIGLKQPNL